MKETFPHREPNWQDIDINTVRALAESLEEKDRAQALFLANMRLEGIRSIPNEVRAATEKKVVSPAQWRVEVEALEAEIKGLKEIITALQKENE